MQGIANDLFGPLHKDYCKWFYYLAVIYFILCVIAVLTAVWMAVSSKHSKVFYLNTSMMIFGYGIFYFQNRLLHSMCVNSL